MRKTTIIQIEDIRIDESSITYDRTYTHNSEHPPPKKGQKVKHLQQLRLQIIFSDENFTKK